MNEPASILGAMQGWRLTVDKILDHAAQWRGDVEVVSRSVEGPIPRTTYSQVHARAKRLSNALKALGVSPGDREEFLRFLEGKIARWWMPDDVMFVDDIPLGATGKIDKKLIRERMKDYVLPTARR